MTTCTQCFGTKQLDAFGCPYGFLGLVCIDVMPARFCPGSTELMATVSTCPRCEGSGEEPARALYSYACEREAEFALDKLEAIAR